LRRRRRRSFICDQKHASVCKLRKEAEDGQRGVVGERGAI